VARALVLAFMFRIGSVVRRHWHGNFSAFRSSVLWVVYNRHERIRCFGVWGG
jgi:hypothetical protein